LQDCGGSDKKLRINRIEFIWCVGWCISARNEKSFLWQIKAKEKNDKAFMSLDISANFDSFIEEWGEKGKKTLSIT
jgi:hypothetical protein